MNFMEKNRSLSEEGRAFYYNNLYENDGFKLFFNAIHVVSLFFIYIRLNINISI